MLLMVQPGLWAKGHRVSDFGRVWSGQKFRPGSISGPHFCAYKRSHSLYYTVVFAVFPANDSRLTVIWQNWQWAASIDQLYLDW